MKKTILMVAILFATVSVNAQEYYVALSGGSTSGTAKKVLTDGGEKGSYGEGCLAQLRFGYLFNEKFGVDLGFGYLHGDDQQIINSGGVDIKGRARAYGLALTGVYNLSQNVYVRGGLLTKLGGKTEIVGSVKQIAVLPAVVVDPTAPPTATVEVPVDVNFTRDNTGKFPLGFIGAFGVKFELDDNWGVFAEMEYQGINVSADKSALGDFSAKIGGESRTRDQIYQLVGQLPPASQAQFSSLLPLIADEITYTENPDSSKFETDPVDAPYSSFGFNFGVTYSFDWGSKK